MLHYMTLTNLKFHIAIYNQMQASKTPFSEGW